MMNQSNPSFAMPKFLIFLCFIVPGFGAMAQTVTGPSPVGLNGTYTYSFNDGSLAQGVSWTTTRGTVGSTWSSGTTYYASITFTSTGSGNIKISDSDGLLYTWAITVNSCTTVTAPTTTGGSRCGAGTVTLTASAPGTGYGIRWYDATSTSSILGTGTSFVTPSLSATSTFYATRYNTSTGCESSKVSAIATVLTVPTASASPVTICSGTATGIVITNNVPSTLNSWTVSSSNASGATAGSGTSGSSSPYTYTLNQTLTATSNVSGTVTYTVTPSASGCTGTPVAVVATVSLLPTASASPVTICSGTATGIVITNNVPGTLNSWTVSSSNASGATASSGTSGSSSPYTYTLNQTFTATSNVSGTVTYTVTPSASGCTGTPVAVVATVKPLPTASASPVTICSGAATGIVITNNVPSTLNSWTVSSSNASGATASSGTSGSSSPYTYTLNQTLTSTSNVNGTATYTVTPSASGCTGTPIAVVATVVPTPTVIVANPVLFSGTTTNINISSNLSGATFSWTVASTNCYGAASGNGIVIGQTLFSNAASNGAAVYAITAAAAGCTGSATATVTVNTPPVVTSASGNVVTSGSNFSLDAGAGYATYAWKNSAGSAVGSSEVYTTNVPDTYRVTVSKTGVLGTATSLPFTVIAQPVAQNINSVVANTMMEAITDTSRIKTLVVDSVNQSSQYFDGLGRTVQSVVMQGSPLKNDIVQPALYDALGREYRKYLPFVAQNNGLYKVGVLDGGGNYAGPAANFYNNGTSDKIVDDTRYFSETVYEPSPFNRSLQDYGPGANWYTNSKAIVHAYPINERGTGTGQERIIAWKVDPTSGMPLRETATNTSVNGGYYSTGQLSVRSTKDEQGHEVRTY